jgi:hypothetical protein
MMVSRFRDLADFINKRQALREIRELEPLLQRLSVNLPASGRSQPALDLVRRHLFAFH